MTPEEELESIAGQRALHLAQLKVLTARRKKLLDQIRFQKRYFSVRQPKPLDEATIARQQAKHDAANARREEALALRIKGFTFRAIGEHFGISSGRASQLTYQCARGLRKDHPLRKEAERAGFYD